MTTRHTCIALGFTFAIFASFGAQGAIPPIVDGPVVIVPHAPPPGIRSYPCGSDDCRSSDRPCLADGAERLS